MGHLIEEGDKVDVSLFSKPISLSTGIEQSKLFLGQIVLIKLSDEWVIHRVVKDAENWNIKGDLNRSFDFQEPSDAIVWGVVKKVYTKIGSIEKPFSNRHYLKLIAQISICYHEKKIRIVRGIAKILLHSFTFPKKLFCKKKSIADVFLDKLKSNKKEIVLKEKEKEEFCKISERHFLQYYLYSKFSNQEKEMFKGWKQQKKIEALRNQMVIDEIKKIGLDIKNNKPSFKPCLIKGVVLLGRVYQDFGTRLMSDVDIYVQPNEKKLMEEFLQEHNYQLVEVDHGKANSSKSMWTKPLLDSEINIELHTKLYWQEPKGVRWKQKDAELEGFSQLNLIDEIVYLSMHLVFSHSFQRLFWLVDIYEILRKHEDEIEWLILWKRAKELEGERAVKSALYAINKIFAYQAVRVKQNFISKFRMSLLSKNFLLNPYKSMFYYLLVKHLIQKSLWNALRYDLSRIGIAFRKRI